MTKSGMNPVHPGEVLREEIDDLGLSANALAKAIDVPANRVTAILNGERGVTADTALRLGRYFDTTARFWLNLQQAWQVRQAEINGGARILAHVIPRQAAALRTAAQQAQVVSAQARSVLNAIVRNIAFCEQLSAVERSASLLESQTRNLRALVGPLDELRRVGILDQALHTALQQTRQRFAEYEARFARPSDNDLVRLIAHLKASATPSNIERFAAMKNPWLDIHGKSRSLACLLGLHQIGESISRQFTFSPAVTDAVRDKLGDWRDAITWPDGIWRDLGARQSFYVGLGFDADLTDLPAPAFREATDLADIRTESPRLIKFYDPPVPPAADAGEEAAFARTNDAYKWLLRFESNLRRLIDTEMKREFGTDWPKHQLPNGLYEQWQEKHDDAVRNGAPPHPLIAYADFTDYWRVIGRRDNWRRVFKTRFRRLEDIRESLQRLYPIRLDTMHARPIGQDDELLLHVEIKRIMRVVAGSAITTSQRSAGQH